MDVTSLSEGGENVLNGADVLREPTLDISTRARNGRADRRPRMVSVSIWNLHGDNYVPLNNYG